ncbi:hypothetical protein NO275_08420, partial [Campylobacter jejuni]|uniref:hypothetical protein n=1 Tax=Campylobacter jejuni TaxID=197 RepID=UPI0027DF9398
EVHNKFILPVPTGPVREEKLAQVQRLHDSFGECMQRKSDLEIDRIEAAYEMVNTIQENTNARPGDDGERSNPGSKGGT